VLHVAEDAGEGLAQVLHGVLAVVGTSRSDGAAVRLLLGRAAAEEGSRQVAGGRSLRVVFGRAPAQERIASAQDVARRLLRLRLRLRLRRLPLSLRLRRRSA